MPNAFLRSSRNGRVRRRSQSGEVRALNIGYVSNLFYDLLPSILALFRQLFPTVSVNLFDMSCGEQFRALEDGKLDRGFVGLHEPIALRGLEFQTIADLKTVAALPKDNPLASKTKVALKALAPWSSSECQKRAIPTITNG